MRWALAVGHVPGPLTPSAWPVKPAESESLANCSDGSLWSEHWLWLSAIQLLWDGSSDIWSEPLQDLPWHLRILSPLDLNSEVWPLPGEIISGSWLLLWSACLSWCTALEVVSKRPTRSWCLFSLSCLWSLASMLRFSRAQTQDTAISSAWSRKFWPSLPPGSLHWGRHFSPCLWPETEPWSTVPIFRTVRISRLLLQEWLFLIPLPPCWQLLWSFRPWRPPEPSLTRAVPDFCSSTCRTWSKPCPADGSLPSSFS